MKKFALLTVGFTPPSPEMMQDWMAWFQSIGDRIETQIGFKNGKEVLADEVKNLDMDLEAITGCLIIRAESMDEALEIAERCPMITSTRVYEVMEHA